MRRLGIVGGTFDPVHTGHVLLALFVLEQLSLDRVLFIPAADPPHKEIRSDMAPIEARWAMVERAIAGLPAFQASRIELERSGKSYTVDTLRQLRVRHPESQLYLIIGEDNVSQLSTWHDPHGILSLCTVVAGSRVTAGLESDSELARKILSVETPLFQISSTQIRDRLAAGKPVRYLLPERVEEYIRARGLYGTGD